MARHFETAGANYEIDAWLSFGAKALSGRINLIGQTSTKLNTAK